MQSWAVSVPFLRVCADCCENEGSLLWSTGDHVPMRGHPEQGGGKIDHHRHRHGITICRFKVNSMPVTGWNSAAEFLSFRMSRTRSLSGIDRRMSRMKLALKAVVRGSATYSTSSVSSVSPFSALCADRTSEFASKCIFTLITRSSANWATRCSELRSALLSITTEMV